MPGKALATAVTVGLKLPFQRDPALRTDREEGSLLPLAKKDDLGDRHGNAEGKLLWRRRRSNTEKLVWGPLKAKTHLLENEERRAAFSSDNFGEWPKEELKEIEKGKRRRGIWVAGEEASLFNAKAVISTNKNKEDSSQVL